jgi:hypothetical protein
MVVKLVSCVTSTAEGWGKNHGGYGAVGMTFYSFFLQQQ